ncbi:ferredoxin family protein [Burkholderia diffusa]|uniref:ferredoxin family protein n=1 Tax=Burkholderia diffusa TaxID=488732 RepID=UPI00264E4AAB|nr:ferredoxin family protein [Burkholderia diffusa]MDN7903366.1 ferredoxin family protein [Burkholderia diffusa]
MAPSGLPLAKHRQRRQPHVTETARNSQHCKAEPGEFKPVVDPKRCEGKGDCVAVCPYTVFEIGRMPDDQFAAMPLIAKLRLWAHGRQTAFTPNSDACRACGACVTSCRERAISLARVA